ncbi:MAG: hypothetical protein K2F97_06280 [Muribaculaceae bacterium]|nr:hypothetical protein [Muribaculaceae bacterium]
MERIVVREVTTKGGCVAVRFDVSAGLRDFFAEREMRVEYDMDLTGLPEAVAVVPFVCNVLPIVWLTDAVLEPGVLDADFYDHIDDIRGGYEAMFPTLRFGGRVCASSETCRGVPRAAGEGDCAALFSGGVDAFATLLRHLDERPVAVTLWGADVRLDDEQGWARMRAHTKTTARQYGLRSVTAKTNFRGFLNERALGRLVAASGDGWWHGFQHGIGILGHVAPVAWAFGLKRVYIASSFSEADKGKYTAASDPTIDNHVHFCGARVVHDGYELERQQKVDLICRATERSGVRPMVHVCWESTGGRNCCGCEKCLRTIYAILAAGGRPADYGFDITARQWRRSRGVVLGAMRPSFRLKWRVIQERLRELPREDVPEGARWLLGCDLERSGRSWPARRKWLRAWAVYAVRYPVGKALRLLGLRR